MVFLLSYFSCSWSALFKSGLASQVALGWISTTDTRSLSASKYSVFDTSNNGVGFAVTQNTGSTANWIDTFPNISSTPPSCVVIFAYVNKFRSRPRGRNQSGYTNETSNGAPKWWNSSSSALEHTVAYMTKIGISNRDAPYKTLLDGQDLWKLRVYLQEAGGEEH